VTDSNGVRAQLHLLTIRIEVKETPMSATLGGFNGKPVSYGINSDVMPDKPIGYSVSPFSYGAADDRANSRSWH
jgi:hypothetical protein